MEQEKLNHAKTVMRGLPLDLVAIEKHLRNSPTSEKLLRDFFQCNRSVLAHRIMGWKECKDELRV